jgi:dolichol-phosphate mannosyltransferase
LLDEDGRLGVQGGHEDAMISSERLPASVTRAWHLGKRFQKFILVGALGLLVNQLFLFIFSDGANMALHFASPISIFLSMIVTFTLNEIWTWHDRGSGHVIHRIGLYFPINMVGLVINYLILQLLVDHTNMHYLIANLIGAGVAAVWNFLVNNSVTWRTQRVDETPGV